MNAGVIRRRGDIRTAKVATPLPPGRVRALFVLLRAGDTMALTADPAQAARPGWNLALRLCPERQDDDDGDIRTDHRCRAPRRPLVLAGRDVGPRRTTIE